MGGRAVTASATVSRQPLPARCPPLPAPTRVVDRERQRRPLYEITTTDIGLIATCLGVVHCRYRIYMG